VVVVVVPFFASTYAAHTFRAPLGWDTPKYLWKTALASHVGVTSLPDRLPPPVNGSPDRPGFAVVALLAGRLLGVTPVRVAEALPFAMAAAIGLACAGFAAVGFGTRRWEAAVVGASVGASAWVARLAGPETYQDNLMVAAVVVAVAALAVAAAARGRGLVAPAVLLGAAALVHWSFALLFAGIVAVAAAALAPSSWRAWRRGESPLPRTPAGALAMVAAGGAAAAVAGLYGALGAGLKAPKTSPQARVEYDKKIRHDLAGYAPWLTVPGAAIGTAALALDRPGSREAAGRRRVAWAVLGAWIAVAVVAGLVAWSGATVPTHRFLAFALPVPLLMAAGAVALPRVLGRRWSAGGRVAGIVVAVVLLCGGFAVAQAFWSGVRPQTNPLLTEQAANAGAYLDAARVPARTPVVFVANVQGNAGVNLALFAHEIRAALPPDRIEHAYLYLGDPVTYLAGHPTIVRPVTRGVADYDGTSWRYFRDVRPLLRHGPAPVALLLPEANPDRSSFARWARTHPEVAPGVVPVTAPAASVSPVPVAAASPAPIAAAPVGWWAVALLAVVWAAGSGWSVAAAPRRSWFTAAALAPAVGVAAVVTSGVVADRAGVRLASGGGVAVLFLTTVLGWAVAAAAGRLRPIDPGSAGIESTRGARPSLTPVEPTRGAEPVPARQEPVP
jgi:MFS family permease